MSSGTRTEIYEVICPANGFLIVLDNQGLEKKVFPPRCPAATKPKKAANKTAAGSMRYSDQRAGRLRGMNIFSRSPFVGPLHTSPFKSEFAVPARRLILVHGPL